MSDNSSLEFSGWTEQEAKKIDKFAQELLLKTSISGAFHPLCTVKTLIQLGHEPFPLSIGRLYGFGRTSYFLPNVLTYARNLSKIHGWTALYCGLDAVILAGVFQQSAVFASNLFMDKYYRDLGGAAVNLNRKESELSDIDGGKRALRDAIRKSVSQSIGVIIARPFLVIMVRKIAQLIGGENKYGSVIAAFYLIGREEGAKGLFSGLAPQLVAEIITVWGTTTLLFALERGLVHVQKNEAIVEDESSSDEVIGSVKTAVVMAVPFIVNSFSYPYIVVSTVMAVAASGLAVSMLPYSPGFSTWFDAKKYLQSTGGLKNGVRLFFREYAGAVSVGADQRLYADNKHFI